LKYGKEEHEFIGSYSTGFIEHDENIFSRPIPNVLGLVRIKKSKRIRKCQEPKLAIFVVVPDSGSCQVI
jgi:hypothetical protein